MPDDALTTPEAPTALEPRLALLEKDVLTSVITIKHIRDLLVAHLAWHQQQINHAKGRIIAPHDTN